MGREGRLTARWALCPVDRLVCGPTSLDHTTSSNNASSCTCARGVLQIKEILETGRLARVEASLADPRIRALYVHAMTEKLVACIYTPPVCIAGPFCCEHTLGYASKHYYLG